MKKQKCLNLGAKICYLGIFVLEFENNVVIFEGSTLKFVFLRNIYEKMEMLKVGPINTLFGYFRAESWK